MQKRMLCIALLVLEHNMHKPRSRIARCPVPRLSAALLVVLAGSAQAENLKALSFEGVISVGSDITGNVFLNAPGTLVGKAVSGRYVFDLDKMPGGFSFNQHRADYEDPLYPLGSALPGSSTGPFMRAFVTIDGYTHEIERAAQPSIPAPVFQRVMMDDVPGNPGQDAINLVVSSFRPQICACVTKEFMDLLVAGVPGGFLTGEDFGQDFNVAVNPGNANSYAQFQILSGFQYGAIYVPSTPAWGVESYHYATGTVALSSLRLESVTAVPEPGGWALMVAGLLGLVGWQRRKQGALAARLLL
jgi:MYXO-CTERM domain-containing protein